MFLPPDSLKLIITDNQEERAGKKVLPLVSKGRLLTAGKVRN